MKKILALVTILFSINSFADVPNVFSSGNKLNAEKLNANFDHLNRRAYRYYRIWMDSTGNGTMLVFNMSFFDKDGNDILDNNSGFTYDVDSNSGSINGASAAFDRVNRTTNVDWQTYGIQTDNTPPHWLSVDLKTATPIYAFGVSFYPGHNPQKKWYLQGSDDQIIWTDIWSGNDSDDDYNDGGTYPVKKIYFNRN